MNKKELVAKVAEKKGYSQKLVNEIATSFFEEITAAVGAGERVQISDFGTFEQSKRSAREGKNPQTGERMMIAATVVPKFKAAKAFKDKVKPE